MCAPVGHMQLHNILLLHRALTKLYACNLLTCDLDSQIVSDDTVPSCYVPSAQ